MPELNDGFAKKVGVTDISAMHTSVSNTLNQQVDEKMRAQLRHQVNDFLTKTYSFDLPLSLIEADMNHRQKQKLKDPQVKTQWDAMSSEQRKNFQDELYRDTINALSLYYLSRQVVRQANLPISHKEVQEEAVAMFQAQGEWNVDAAKISKEMIAFSLSRVILRKAQDHILSQNLSH